MFDLCCNLVNLNIILILRPALSLRPVVNRPLSDRAEPRALVPTVLQLPLQPAGAARDWYQGDATAQTCLLPNLPHYSTLSGISGRPSLRSCSGSPAPGGPQSRWAGASWGPGWWSGATPARGSSRGRPGWSRLWGYSGRLSTCLASTLARSPPSSKRRKGVIKSSYSVSPPPPLPDLPPWLSVIPPDPGLGPQLTYSVLAEKKIRIYCSVQQVFPQPTLGLTIYTETAGGGSR